MTAMPLRRNAGTRTQGPRVEFELYQTAIKANASADIENRRRPNVERPEGASKFSNYLDQVAIMPQTVEETHALRLPALQKSGALRPGASLRWGWGQSARTIALRCDAETIELVFTAAGNVVRQHVPLIRTPCNFGGERTWFQCPCGRRTAALFDARETFACRQCLGLTYSIQQEAPRWRPLRGAQAIRRRLGGSASIVEPFPPRPRYMHRATYKRLAEKAGRYEQKTIGQIAAWRASISSRG